jgi:hypothetical protein
MKEEDGAGGQKRPSQNFTRRVPSRPAARGAYHTTETKEQLRHCVSRVNNKRPERTWTMYRRPIQRRRSPPPRYYPQDEAVRPFRRLNHARLGPLIRSIA